MKSEEKNRRSFKVNALGACILLYLVVAGITFSIMGCSDMDDFGFRSCRCGREHGRDREQDRLRELEIERERDRDRERERLRELERERDRERDREPAKPKPLRPFAPHDGAVGK